MTFIKSTIASASLAIFLSACQPAAKENQTPPVSETQLEDVETLVWEDLMPSGEEEILEKLYADFYETQENQFREQLTLSEAANAKDNLISLIDEGSVQDTMEQIGTYNVVEGLDGAKIRLPGYVVPLDFSASSEYDQFLLVPYFGACLHTPPPPPNQIVFVKSSPATKITAIDEPVWIEGIMKTGKFGSELGNSAYELTLIKLEPYEY